MTRRTRSTSTFKRRLRKLGIAVIVLVLFSILAEFFVRCFLPEPLRSPIGPRYLVERDPFLGIRLRPGFSGRHEHPEFDVPVQINAFGFRDRELGERKPEGTFRILALGDSFTYGYGVHAADSYPKQLERLLDARFPERSHEVINMGCPSYSTVQMGVLMDRWIDRLEPDLVLFTFLIADDLETNAAPPMTERGGLPFHVPIAEAIDASWRYTFAVDVSDIALHWVAWEMRRDHGIDLSDPLSGLHRSADAPPAPVALEAFVKETPEAIAALWPLTDEVLGKVFARIHATGARALLVNLPLPHQVDDDLWRRSVEYYDLDVRLYDFDVVRRHLEEVAHGHGGQFVDLTQGFRERGASGEHFFPLNLHFTKEGNRLAAEILCETLARSGWIETGR
ncbi:MAG: hypothetical protein H6834_05360 [Planctomycetes bacterium]|nr:hypothetical protein [Planctomycetota bacterium]